MQNKLNIKHFMTSVPLKENINQPKNINQLTANLKKSLPKKPGQWEERVQGSIPSCGSSLLSDGTLLRPNKCNKGIYSIRGDNIIFSISCLNLNWLDHSPTASGKISSDLVESEGSYLSRTKSNQYCGNLLLRAELLYYERPSSQLSMHDLSKARKRTWLPNH